jgi:hypothetical protein
LSRQKLIWNCLKGLILLEDRFNLVTEEHVKWICERLSWHKTLPLAAAFSDPAKPKCKSLESVFQTVSVQNTLREISYERQIRQLFQMLEAASITFMPFKGPFWSQQIYPEYAWKHIGDIDLLLTNEDARNASALLQETGYFPDIIGDSEREDFHKRGEMGLHPDPGQIQGVPVELHWELLPSPRFVKKQFLYPQDFTQQSTEAQWKGITYRLPMPEVQFFYYLLHATCQHQFTRFVHVVNLAHFLGKHPQLDWRLLQKLAEQRDAATPVHYGLRFIHKFSTLPKSGLELMNSLRPPFTNRLAASILTPKAMLFFDQRRGRFRRKIFRAAMSW